MKDTFMTKYYFLSQVTESYTATTVSFSTPTPSSVNRTEIKKKE